MGLKETILAAQDLDKEPIDLANYGWPDGLFVRSLTAMERVKLTSEAVIKERTGIPRMAAMCLVDKDGAQVFNADDWKEVAKKAAGPIEEIADLCMQLSGLGEDEANEIKNASGEAETNASPTDSHFLSE